MEFVIFGEIIRKITHKQLMNEIYYRFYIDNTSMKIKQCPRTFEEVDIANSARPILPNVISIEMIIRFFEDEKWSWNYSDGAGRLAILGFNKKSTEYNHEEFFSSDNLAPKTYSFFSDLREYLDFVKLK
jgi:hypothetical protein